MNDEHFPIGQRIVLPGHFVRPVTLEAVRRIGSSYECRVRLSDGTPDEAIITADETSRLIGQRIQAAPLIHPADAEKVQLLVESARIRLAYPRWASGQVRLLRTTALAWSRSGSRRIVFGTLRFFFGGSFFFMASGPP